MMLQIFVPGKPVAQPRQRHRAVSSRGKAWVQNYTPKNSPVNAYKQAIALAAKEQIGATSFTGPVIFNILFSFGEPKNSRKCRSRYRNSKPDIDNLIKAVFDALVDCGVLQDDSQVVSILATKLNEGPPGTLIRLGEIR